jgi:hypothetical protein
MPGQLRTLPGKSGHRRCTVRGPAIQLGDEPLVPFPPANGPFIDSEDSRSAAGGLPFEQQPDRRQLPRLKPVFASFRESRWLRFARFRFLPGHIRAIPDICGHGPE